MEKKSIPYSERKFDRAKKSNYDMEYRKNNYERIEITAPKGTKEKLKGIATENGMSLAEYIRFKLDI